MVVETRHDRLIWLRSQSGSRSCCHYQQLFRWQSATPGDTCGAMVGRPKRQSVGLDLPILPFLPSTFHDLGECLHCKLGKVRKGLGSCRRQEDGELWLSDLTAGTFHSWYHIEVMVATQTCVDLFSASSSQGRNKLQKLGLSQRLQAWLPHCVRVLAHLRIWDSSRLITSHNENEEEKSWVFGILCLPFLELRNLWMPHKKGSPDC